MQSCSKLWTIMTYFLLKSCTCTIGWFFKIKIITWKHYQTCFCSESFIPLLCNFKLPPPLVPPFAFPRLFFKNLSPPPPHPWADSQKFHSPLFRKGGGRDYVTLLILTSTIIGIPPLIWVIFSSFKSTFTFAWCMLC